MDYFVEYYREHTESLTRKQCEQELARLLFNIQSATPHMRTYNYMLTKINILKEHLETGEVK